MSILQEDKEWILATIRREIAAAVKQVVVTKVVATKPEPEKEEAKGSFATQFKKTK